MAHLALGLLACLLNLYNPLLWSLGFLVTYTQSEQRKSRKWNTSRKISLPAHRKNEGQYPFHYHSVLTCSWSTHLKTTGQMICLEDVILVAVNIQAEFLELLAVLYFAGCWLDEWKRGRRRRGKSYYLI